MKSELLFDEFYVACLFLMLLLAVVVGTGRSLCSGCWAPRFVSREGTDDVQEVFASVRASDQHPELESEAEEWPPPYNSVLVEPARLAALPRQEPSPRVTPTRSEGAPV
jgi:hypothetical protein